MKAIRAIYLANAREFLRDRMAVIFVLVLPVVLMTFFGLVFSGSEESSPLLLGVVNEDAGPAGEQFVSGLFAPEVSGVFNVYTDTREAIMESLNQGDLGLAMVLPADLSTSLAASRPITVEVFYDPAQPAAAGFGLVMVQNMLSEANLIMADAPRLFVAEPKTVQSEPLRMVDLFVPGLLGVALLWLGLFGTAMPLVQQREAQILRRLNMTPLTPAGILAAQVAWRVTVGLLQALLMVVVGYLAFGVEIEGNKLLFLAAVLMGALVFVSMGYLLAGLASSEEGVVGITQLVNFPMMFLSGTFFPIETMPDFFRPVVNLMPLTYLRDALGQIMIGANPMYPLWLDFAVLGGWLVICLALAAKFWRWE